MCKRQRASLCTKQMALMLEEQMSPDKTSFSFVEIDYVGPLILKAGRTHLKRYRYLFMCLTIRVVYLKVAHSFTADPLLMSFNASQELQKR